MNNIIAVRENDRVMVTTSEFKDKPGVVTNIKYDAVAYKYKVKFDDNTSGEFYKFQVVKAN